MRFFDRSAIELASRRGVVNSAEPLLSSCHHVTALRHVVQSNRRNNNFQRSLSTALRRRGVSSRIGCHSARRAAKPSHRGTDEWRFEIHRARAARRGTRQDTPIVQKSNQKMRCRCGAEWSVCDKRQPPNDLRFKKQVRCSKTRFVAEWGVPPRATNSVKVENSKAAGSQRAIVYHTFSLAPL
jgi:hypothetical protein